MARYHVTYFYLATGMEGRAQEEDYGVVRAGSPEEALDKVLDAQFPTATGPNREWVRGCLTAKKSLRKCTGVLARELETVDKGSSARE